MAKSVWPILVTVTFVAFAIPAAKSKLRIDQQKDLRMIKLLWDSVDAFTALEYAKGGSDDWKPLSITPSVRRKGFILFRREDICTNYVFRTKGPMVGITVPSQEVSTDPEGPLITETMNPRLRNMKLEGNTIKLRMEWDMANFPGWTLNDLTPKLRFFPVSCSDALNPITKVTGVNTGEIVVGKRMVDAIRQGNGSCLAAIFVPSIRVKCGKSLDTFVTYVDGKAQPGEYFKVVDINCETIKEIECPPRRIPPYCAPEVVKTISLGKGKALAAWKFPQPGSDFLYPKRTPKSYEVNYGRLVDDGKPLIYQEIEDERIKSVPGTQRYTILNDVFKCDVQYRVQICAVFDLPTSSINWHVVNSYLLKTRRSCRERKPGDPSSMLSRSHIEEYLGDLQLNQVEMDKIMTAAGV